MKRAAWLLVLAALAATPSHGASEARQPFLFLAWNPGAALSFLPTGFLVRSILPVAAFNQEAGVAIAGGRYENGFLVEGRAAVGNSNATYLVLQLQAGGSWFFGEALGWPDKGPYLGASLRYWDLVQLYSGVQTHHIAPVAYAGWWFDFGPWFLDLRVSQPLAIATFSSLAHATPGLAFFFSPLPGISAELPIGLIQVGIKF